MRFCGNLSWVKSGSTGTPRNAPFFASQKIRTGADPAAGCRIKLPVRSFLCPGQKFITGTIAGVALFAALLLPVWAQEFQVKLLECDGSPPDQKKGMNLFWDDFQLFRFESLYLIGTKGNPERGIKEKISRLPERSDTLIRETPLKSEYIRFEQKNGETEIIWEYDVKPSDSVKGAVLEFMFTKGARPGNGVPFGKKLKSFSVELPNGVISADFTGSTVLPFIEDMRKFKWAPWANYRIVFHLPYSPKQGGRGILRMKLKRLNQEPGIYQPLSLDGRTVRPLADEIPGDRKGGWTDQGKQDMSGLEPGLYHARGIPFRINGKAIVLWGKSRPYFPESSHEILLGGRKVERLCFFHSCAWTPAQRIKVMDYEITFSDGNKKVVPVLAGADILDWWNPGSDGVMCRLAWKGTTGGGIGAVWMMQWKNPEPGNAVRSIRAVSAKTQAIPILLAVTAVHPDSPEPAVYSALDKLFSRRDAQKLVDTKSWYEIRMPFRKPILPGSALDLSFLNHKPAGKYGFVKTAGDHFEFEKLPGKEIRFWGGNTRILPKEYAPFFARLIAAKGYNIIRIHGWGSYHRLQLDMFPWNRGWNMVNPDGTWNQKALDRFDFFVAELKKNGIYIVVPLNEGFRWDWYSGIGDSGDAGGRQNRESLYNRRLIEETKRLAREFYCRKNKYTGLSLIEDPAVALFSEVNEMTLTFNWGVPFRKDRPRVVNGSGYEELNSLWLQDQKKRGVKTPVPLLGGYAQYSFGPEGLRFFAGLQQKYYEEMRGYLKRLGVKVPVIGPAWSLVLPDIWSCRNMDALDQHAYSGSGPSYKGLPGTDDAAVLPEAPFSSGAYFRQIGRMRYYNKPVTITEWEFCYPGNHRAQGVPLMAAFASFQGWNAPFHFTLIPSHINIPKYDILDPENEIRLTAGHSALWDPSTGGFIPGAAMAFRRFDIAKAKHEVVITYDDERVFANRNFIDENPFFLNMARVSSRILQQGEKPQWPVTSEKSGKALQSEAAAKFGVRMSRDYLETDTGEIRHFLNPGLYLVDTPKTQMAIGALISMGINGRTLSAFDVNSPENFASIVFTSLDGKPLKESARILLTFGNNSRNKTGVFKDNLQLDPGMGPVIAEPLTADIGFRSPGSRKVFILDPETGARRREIPVKNNRFRIGKDSHSIYFEILR